MTSIEKEAIDKKLEGAQQLLSRISIKDLNAPQLNLVTAIIEYLGGVREEIVNDALFQESKQITRITCPAGSEPIFDTAVKSIEHAPEYGPQAFRVHLEDGSSLVIFNATSITEKKITE